MVTSALNPLIWKIRGLFQKLRTFSDAMLQDLGINASERGVLETLSDGQPLSVPQIAKQFSVSRQHVQTLVNELRSKGLITSVENPSHKRSPLVSISPKGKKLFALIIKTERDLLSVLQSRFSNTDLAITLKTLETLEELLELRERE